MLKSVLFLRERYQIATGTRSIATSELAVSGSSGPRVFPRKRARKWADPSSVKLTDDGRSEARLIV